MTTAGERSATAAELLALGAATLGESGAAVVPAGAGLRPAWPDARLAGPAYGVRMADGDNLAVHVAVARAPVGSVLVVEPLGRRDLGFWGEVLTTAAQARGLVGLVINGGVRDVDALARHRFPAFSSTIALPGAMKAAGGTVGGAATVGGITVATGDWVVGDADGVVVIGAASLDAVLAAGRARAEKEATMFDRLRAGATTIELLSLDPSPVTIAAHPDD